MSEMNVEVSKIYVNDGTNHTKLAYEEPYAPCSFTNGTDAEIKEALEKHYAGKINLADYWSVGDTRVIHLDAMQAPNPNSSSTWAAQDITVVIVDMNHNDLATPINGISKAAITVQTRETLSGIAGAQGNIFIDGSSSKDTSFTKWSNLYMRTYLNSTVLGAISSGDFKSAIKQSTHSRLTTNGNNPMTANTGNGSKTDRTTESVTDTLFLPSYPEIFGNTQYTSYLGGGTPSSEEGTQFSYYATASNRIKYGNNNGVSNGTVGYWWNGSASSGYVSNYGYYWCGVNTDGAAYVYRGNYSMYLAPAWCM